MQKKILIDGGGNRERENFNVGESILLPYLLDRKIKELDYVFISHFDADHYCGLLYVLENIQVRKIIFLKQKEETPEFSEVMEIANRKKIEIKTLKAGDKIKLEKDISLEVIYPVKEIFEDKNNNSMVLKLKYKDFSMLFTGDIEEKAEQEILKNKVDLQATVLKVAHHGAKTSSTEEFIKRVMPQIALIGVGENNNFGHPSHVILQRLEKQGTKIYRTDEKGEIIINVDKDGKLKIKTQITNIF